MANSVFHNIYTSQYAGAVSNVAEEDFGAIATFRLLCLETVLNTFTWTNLPKDCLPYSPERYACWWSMFAMFKDDSGELKLFPAYPSGMLKENGQYDRYTIVAMNGKNWTVSRDEIALCYNNTLGTPSIGIINELADKMANALRAVDCALERSMMPVVFQTAEPEDFKTLSGLYDGIKNKLPFRVMQSESVISDIKTINDTFDIHKYDILALFDVFTKYRNLFYQTFGINTLNVLKKERVTTDEATADEGTTTFTLLDGMFSRREEFCKEAKEKFGSDISFEINRGASTKYTLTTTDTEQIENFIKQTVPETEQQEEKNEDE